MPEVRDCGRVVGIDVSDVDVWGFVVGLSYHNRVSTTHYRYF